MSMKTLGSLRCKDTILTVGIDIAKFKHVAVAQDGEGRFSRPHSFENSFKGFQSFAAWLSQTLIRMDATGVVIGLEPTGHYGKALEDWLLERGFELRQISGVLTRRAKDMLDGDPLKTDAKDAAVIADLVRQGKGRTLSPLSGVFQDLRYLAEMRRRLVVERAALLNRLHRLLDLLFPELPKLFAKLDSASLFALLKVAPRPGAVLVMGELAVAQLLKKTSRGRLGGARANALLQAAQQSIGVQRGAEALCQEMRLLLPRIEELTRQRKEIEKQMTQELSRIDYAPQLLSIPGLGTISTAIILGELGDLRGYRNARQVFKMAGLKLFEISSGKQKGQVHITKRGRSQLRWVCYMAVLRMIGKGKTLHAFYQKHIAVKPSGKAIVAGMRRLLRMIFSIVRYDQVFQPEKLEVKSTTVSAKLAA